MVSDVLKGLSGVERVATCLIQMTAKDLGEPDEPTRTLRYRTVPDDLGCDRPSCTNGSGGAATPASTVRSLIRTMLANDETQGQTRDRCRGKLGKSRAAQDCLCSWEYRVTLTYKP